MTSLWTLIVVPRCGRVTCFFSLNYYENSFWPQLTVSGYPFSPSLCQIFALVVFVSWFYCVCSVSLQFVITGFKGRKQHFSISFHPACDRYQLFEQRGRGLFRKRVTFCCVSTTSHLSLSFFLSNFKSFCLISHLFPLTVIVSFLVNVSRPLVLVNAGTSQLCESPGAHLRLCTEGGGCCWYEDAVKAVESS